ncbi:hypothetical protein CPC08DRAFT_446028 [Agrocybe pediades]|nr:hypothetical protein CPC08DRAFT_446028 [Agrocybe pediades]
MDLHQNHPHLNSRSSTTRRRVTGGVRRRRLLRSGLRLRQSRPRSGSSHEWKHQQQDRRRIVTCVFLRLHLGVAVEISNAFTLPTKGSMLGNVTAEGRGWWYKWRRSGCG